MSPVTSSGGDLIDGSLQDIVTGEPTFYFNYYTFTAKEN
jgi:hypothetical protein